MKHYCIEFSNGKAIEEVDIDTYPSQTRFVKLADFGALQSAYDKAIAVIKQSTDKAQS